jgi:SAM-dependent methyltransferase
MEASNRASRSRRKKRRLTAAGPGGVACLRVQARCIVLKDHESFDVDASFEAYLPRAEELWGRIGEKPDFRGKDVMEVGSATGELTAAVALQGARSVLGVDISQDRVDWCTGKFASRFPHLTNVKFSSTPTDQMPGEDCFDIIFSQNTFEHIADVDAVLASFRRLLKPGGVAYVGFSPLYHSPFGDHGELRAPVKAPWLHLIAGRKRVIAAFNRANRENVATLQDCGFNGYTPAQFVKAFRRSGLEIEVMKFNRTEGRLKQLAMDVFCLLAKAPGLQRYFTTGMYLKLRKPAPGQAALAA